MFLKKITIITSIIIVSVLFSVTESKAMILPTDRADSLIVNQLRSKGVHFSKNNSVALLKSGQEKFNDMFKAIEQAKSSIHLEYFNFRNDSINKELIKRLAVKAKEAC